jgi:polysaccharide biosynthesis protein PslH
VNVLFLAQRIPYPPNRGDKITTWRLIERMQRTHNVTVVAFAHDDADLEAAEELRRKGFTVFAFRHRMALKKALSLPLLITGKPLTLGVYGSSAMQRKVDELMPKMAAAYAYSSSMGAFLVGRELPWVMHFAELDSDKWSQYARKVGFPGSWLYAREARTLAGYESRLAESARTNVFCTPLEQRIFDDAIPGRPSTVLRNGVDLDYFQPQRERAEANHLVFTGVMDYFPNVDGCVHFTAEILPLVREEYPDARFTIIGSRPSTEVQRLAATPGVTVTGFVDDVRDSMHVGAVSVAPLRIARGIQNKVLEAMALGLPIVGTTSATQGVNATAGHDYMVADSAEDQAQAICSLLADTEKARTLGAAGRRYVEEHYDWEVTLGHLDEILELCTQS